MTLTCTTPLDVVAIGLGPFNLGLACLMAPLAGHRSLFLERAGSFAWHPGMLIDDSALQNPFLADLVSLADPTSRYSYLNYRKSRGQLFSWFLQENFYLSRREYDRYCRWAASTLDTVRFDHCVDAIHFDAARGLYRVEGVHGLGHERFGFECRKLVIGVGTAPSFPACCTENAGLVHTANYLEHKACLQSRRSITVVGSGQSAAEVYRDLLRDSERRGYALHWITRSSRFFAMDTSRLALELLCPDYIDHFFELPTSSKERVAREHRSIYNGINAKLIAEIHDLLTARRGTGGFEGHLLSNSELVSCRRDAVGGGHELGFVHTETGQAFRHRTDGVVFGTGYAAAVPGFLAPIRDRIRWDERGRYAQARNYSVDLAGNAVFVQNAGFQSHGFTNPDLSLACHRNAELIESLTGIAHYTVERGVSLQDFAPPPGSRWFEVEAARGSAL